MEALNNALESLEEYNKQQKLTQNSASSSHQTNRSRSNNDDSWKPPPQNSLKLNVDAHRLAGDGRWALGLIMRMEDGTLVGARTRLVCGIDEAIEAEARGLDEAIEYATIFADRRIIIELDNSEVVKEVQQNHYPRKYWGQIARRSGDYINANSNIRTIQWVRRSGNEAAHQMAKWAEIEPNRTWADNYPPHIVTLVQNEIMAIPASVV